MHMGDGLVSPLVAGTMMLCTAGVTAYSIKKFEMEDGREKIPVMGVMGAFVFAAQMINFTIPGTGSSGHLSGAMLLSAILGPYAGFLTTMAVLIVQALMFGDGGILALGCNVWNMAFYGCFIGALVIWKMFMKKEVSKKKIILASIIGSIVTLQLGAFSVTLQTLASNITELPFGMFLASMQPIHLVIGLVEGLITASVLCFVYEARPKLLWTPNNEVTKEGKLSYKNTLATLVIVTVFIGGFLSLAASSNPDGLEWSMENVAGTAEVEGNTEIHETIREVQESIVPLPDYAFKSSDSLIGTSFSGILGGAVVTIVCLGLCQVLGFNKRRTENEG